MSDKINPVREVDAEACDLARELILENRYGALGVNEPDTRVPLVSRVAVAWSEDTGLFFAASDLSMHSKALLLDRVCSLMMGEPGKGDGLAYPRITLVGEASRMPNTSEDRAEFRTVFVEAHPKASLYIDFADFGFYPVSVSKAYLNGGFGKAYHLQASDLAFIGG